jgi:hypothetical protein
MIFKIPFSLSGLNPGKWLEEYMKRLNPNNPYIHQRPKQKHSDRIS